MTARYVWARPTWLAASARSGSALRGTFVWTVAPIDLMSPTGSLMKPPLTIESRIPDRTSCWRAARVKSLSPAGLRTRA